MVFTDEEKLAALDERMAEIRQAQNRRWAAFSNNAAQLELATTSPKERAEMDAIQIARAHLHGDISTREAAEAPGVQLPGRDDAAATISNVENGDGADQATGEDVVESLDSEMADVGPVAETKAAIGEPVLHNEEANGCRACTEKGLECNIVTENNDSGACEECIKLGVERSFGKQ